MSITGLDHLVYGVLDLEEGIEDLHRRLGVRAAAGGSHPGIGTHNALLSLGQGSYLEVIAPDPNQPTPPNPRPFSLDELRQSRLVAWAIGTADIDDAIAQARRRGYDPGDPIEMARTTPDGTHLRWRLTLNSLAGGPVPFLISWGDTTHPATSAPNGLLLDGFEIEHPDPEPLTGTLQALGCTATVRMADAVALVARVIGRRGVVVLG